MKVFINSSNTRLRSSCLPSSVLTEAKVRNKQMWKFATCVWSHFRNKAARISAWKLTVWNLLTLTAPFHFSPLSVLVFSQLLYNLTSIYSSLWALSSISRIFFSTALSSLAQSVCADKKKKKIPPFQSWTEINILISVVVRYGHKKPALSPAGLSRVVSFLKGNTSVWSGLEQRRWAPCCADRTLALSYLMRRWVDRWVEEGESVKKGGGRK